MAVRLLVVEDPEALAAAAAAEFVRLAAAAIRERGGVRVALAGGGTPRATYERIAAVWRDAPGGPLAWERVHFFWGDERMVPAEDPRSNYGMARAALIERVPVPDANVHPIPADAANPAVAAARYEATLREAFAEKGGTAIPRFDLVILGVGADGHTASLFPGDPSLRERSRLAVATRHPDTGEPRVTLTLPVLNNAAATIVLAAGGDKSEVLRRAVSEPDRPAGGGGGGPEPLPIERLRPTAGTLLFLADKDAAPRARSGPADPNA
ncbi:MAG TPA: 6-phosphogluconolactonase [Candidatus Eisenbacteria bacterium]|nr:6-phosphogluconolactonase [Candidatus Eisenbacteria bacterium]